MAISVSDYTATCAAGVGLEQLRLSLRNKQSGLSRNNLTDCDLDTWIGRVGGVEEVMLPANLRHLFSRNNQLAWLGLQQDSILSTIDELKSRIGAERIGVVMGTSTSSIGRTEEAYTMLDTSGRISDDYLQPEIHNLHSPGIFVAAATGLDGPSLTISTACSSSTKVFATATRWMNHGLVDAVLVGGIDSLCLSTLYGFNSLELVSSNPCRPFDERRDGINIGEAAGFALLTRTDRLPNVGHTLLGYGESSDAHHMAHPHPEGKGAIIAIDRALGRAAIPAESIGYINLHGTASKANDGIEALALAKRFTSDTLASSTKGWTGHTLGAAGIIEAVIALDALETGLIPGTLNCEQPDPDLCFTISTKNTEKSIQYSMSNSFGFGGSNASLIFGRCND